MRRIAISQKKIKILVISLLSLLVIGSILLFIFRNVLLDQVIEKAVIKMQRDYQCNLGIKEAQFDGLDHIYMKAISLKPMQGDTIVTIGELKTGFNFWKILTGTLQVTDLSINRGYIQWVKTVEGSNFDAFLKSKKEAGGTKKATDYADFVNRLTTRFLNLIPTQMQVEGFALKVNDKGHQTQLDFTQLTLNNNQLESQIKVAENNKTQWWRLAGFADPRNRKTDLLFKNLHHDTVQLPFIQHQFHLKTAFKSARFQLKNLGMEQGEFHANGMASIHKLILNHPKIASKDVAIQQAQVDFHWILGERQIQLDSNSQITLGKLKCRPYLLYAQEKGKTIALQLKIPKTKAQDFITALPKGLFSHFEGMQASGNFSYQLDFKFNDQQPNDLVFESKLQPENLKITHYGAADLRKINSGFIYRAIENGIAQRPIIVGPENLMYTPLSAISPYLQKCVLTSEDPSFMHHSGFISEAFKQSIAKNIRTKKFARGASTISMQLVKNVFLTREKTLSRKLEEILLVYILEKQRIATKERMLEVYFNIIEWGPNVYGIGEAAQYYFQKKPEALTFKECLYLATIIPKPKGFMYRFDSDRKEKKFALQQQNFLTQLMLRRKWITPEDTLGYSQPLQLTGEALSRLKTKVADTIQSAPLLDEFIEF